MERSAQPVKLAKVDYRLKVTDLHESDFCKKAWDCTRLVALIVFRKALFHRKFLSSFLLILTEI